MDYTILGNWFQSCTNSPTRDLQRTGQLQSLLLVQATNFMPFPPFDPIALSTVSGVLNA